MTPQPRWACRSTILILEHGRASGHPQEAPFYHGRGAAAQPASSTTRQPGEAGGAGKAGGAGEAPPAGAAPPVQLQGRGRRRSSRSSSSSSRSNCSHSSSSGGGKIAAETTKQLVRAGAPAEPAEPAEPTKPGRRAACPEPGHRVAGARWKH